MRSPRNDHSISFAPSRSARVRLSRGYDRTPTSSSASMHRWRASPSASVIVGSLRSTTTRSWRSCGVEWHAMAWEHFPHGADVGVRGIGATREEAFAQAALALTAVLTDPARVVSKDAIDIRCEAPDGEPLDRERHRPRVEVKGATYTALSVAQGPDSVWIAQCVVDV